MQLPSDQPLVSRLAARLQRRGRLSLSCLPFSRVLHGRQDRIMRPCHDLRVNSTLAAEPDLVAADLVDRQFAPPGRTSCGSPTLPSTPPEKGRCSARSCMRPTPAGWRASQSTPRRPPRWSPTRTAWQSTPPAPMPAWSSTRTGACSSGPGHSPTAPKPPGWCRRCSVGDCFDNSMIEAFWSRMQVELLDWQRWHSRLELANAIFEYLEIWHNRQRRHSSLGWLAPLESENRLPMTVA
ncbi:MAG TPA: integrase core domain-containing protein [Jiangellaceae bacterium]